MLVLSRKIGEKIVIEPGIEISVVEVRGGRVRLGVSAPAHVGIRRQEVEPRANVVKPAAGRGAQKCLDTSIETAM
ncbi:MAG: carbon storage regulator [Planctomycetales bacterium]